jgi:hypothetical protein
MQYFISTISKKYFKYFIYSPFMYILSLPTIFVCCFFAPTAKNRMAKMAGEGGNYSKSRQPIWLDYVLGWMRRVCGTVNEYINDNPLHE